MVYIVKIMGKNHYNLYALCRDKSETDISIDSPIYKIDIDI